MYFQKFTGKNVYGILRAPRSASLEALVVSVPYRPLASVYPTTLPGLALMYSLAKYFRRNSYFPLYCWEKTCSKAVLLQDKNTGLKI